MLVVAALVLERRLRAGGLRRGDELPQAPAPRRPVLFFNPKSGGGKAERFSLAAEARARGIEPIELGPAWDLEQLVRDAVAGGADGLAMAGGDGSQAIVAAIAAEHDLPYACVPGGHAQPLRARPRRRPRRRRRRARRVRRRRRAPRRPGRGQRAGVRQQRLARALRRGRPARGLPRGEAAHAAGHDARGARPRRRRARPALERARAGTSTARAPRSSSRTTATGSAVRSARAPARGSTTGCSGSRSRAARPAAAAAGACRSDRGASGPRRRSRSMPTTPSPRASTARRCKLEPPLRFRIRPGVLRVRIARAASRRVSFGVAARGLRGAASCAGPDRRRSRRT